MFSPKNRYNDTAFKVPDAFVRRLLNLSPYKFVLNYKITFCLSDFVSINRFETLKKSLSFKIQLSWHKTLYIYIYIYIYISVGKWKMTNY